VTERLRKEAEKAYDSKEEFLKSLGLKLKIYEDDDSCLPRLAQLTEKTNQFNTLKEPLSEAQIKAFIESKDHAIYHASLQDNFGDHGVILFALVEKNKETWNIKSLLMSCRVFGRDVEEAFLAMLMKKAYEEGVTSISISFAETEKNIPAKEFIDKHFVGFRKEVGGEIRFPEAVILV
jgi:FkbH-like protein